jgi:hypothetical protein
VNSDGPACRDLCVTNFLWFSIRFFSLPSVSVTGILAVEEVVVHAEAHVVALCFVSR